MEIARVFLQSLPPSTDNDNANNGTDLASTLVNVRCIGGHKCIAKVLIMVETEEGSERKGDVYEGYDDSCC